MFDHRLWHVFVLACALLGAGGAGVLLLAPLVFGTPPPGLERARPLLWVLVGLALAVVAAEWQLVH